ncbi:hypothetical protein FMUND_10438 [Fusarium mundagurra]|uniref:Uncharacterized protein n=1 Tax=Fusarium mundagurra TaxID=1567541 RepID=A0A8H6D968_9HYPO|nr:hypothetical protein FMUND_10438 [Fusarium mundagurra]
MSKPLESDPPLIDKDDPERLSPAALRLANDQPREFVKYLRRVWDTNRRQVLESTKLLHQLRRVKVTCHDGQLHPLSKAWVPTGNLVSICSSFLSPQEPFRFLILNDKKLDHEARSSWDYLREIGCQYEVGDQFLTDLLLTIKKTWPANVKDPGRVFGIYAYFHRRLDQPSPDGTYYKLLSDDENWKNFNARELLLYNGRWIKPSSCFLHAPDYVRSKRVLVPVPAGTDASSSEPLWKGYFYRVVLRIPDFPKTWSAIINELRALQSSTSQISIQQVVELYRALDELQLSESERITIRKLFLQHSLVAVQQCSVIKWQTHLTCIWSPLMKLRDLTELSRPYPDLKDFFVGLLKVEEVTDKTILSRMSYWTPDSEMRDLFILLNHLIGQSEISINPEELLPQRIFLGKLNRENYRFIGTEEFFIPDDQEFAATFKDDLPLLDVTAEEIALLDPLFTWLGFKDRYLSKRVLHRCIWPPTAQERKIEWDVAQRAEGILRDASHPVDKLVVYVSSHKEDRDLALFTALPQRLMQWLMADPKTQTWRAATSRGVSLLKNVLTAPPNVIDALLTSEGVGRIRIIEVNLTTMRQEATTQNTTSNEPTNQPLQSRSEDAPLANTPTKTSANALAKQPATPVRSSEQPESVAGPSSARVLQQTTRQADQPQSTSGRYTESPLSDIKAPSKDEPVPGRDEDVYKPRYASISERPKLKPRLRKRSGSPSSSTPTPSPLSQIPDDVIRGIERLRIADTSEVTLQSPKRVPVA